MHPFHFSLSLLKSVIDNAPKVFPVRRREEMLKIYETMAANPQTTQAEIEKAIIDFGKEIWPYRKAFQEMYKRYGQAKEESLIRDKLNPELLTKFLEFLRKGGRLEDFRHGAVFEETFTAEEKFILGQANLAVHEQIMEEIENLCQGEKKAEFQELLEEFQELEKRLLEKINILKGLANQNPKWALEINERVRAFEEGFSFIEKTYREEDIDGVIDYYRGVIEFGEF
jgi:hypothetical protein